MTSAEARLAVALLAREWRPARIGAALLLLALAGAALGRDIVARGLAEPQLAELAPGAIGSLGDLLLWQVGRGLGVPFAVGACLLAIERISADHDAGWLPGLTATGMRRSCYLLVVAGGVAGLVWGLYLGTTLAFAGAAAHTLGQPALAGMLAVLRAMPGPWMLILSATLYGATCAAFARRRGVAIALAFGGVLLPAFVLAWYENFAGQGAPELARRLLALHIPPPSLRSDSHVLVRHLVYCAAVLVLLVRAAPRVVARYR